jgi:hypothetical protein
MSKLLWTSRKRWPSGKSAISAVWTKKIPEYCPQPRGLNDFSTVEAKCKKIGVHCSDLVFYHANLGPTNIIVEFEPRTRSVGIIDFEMARYLPRQWVQTKFWISSGMNLSDAESPTRWRADVQQLLGKEGFEDYSEDYML